MYPIAFLSRSNHSILGMPRISQALSETESSKDFSAVTIEHSYGRFLASVCFVFTMNKQARRVCGQHDGEDWK